MLEPIMGHRHTTNEIGKIILVNHPNNLVVETNDLYNYVLDGNYPELTRAIIAEWVLKGITTKDVSYVGWAIKAPKRVSWITLTVDNVLSTYVSTDKELEEFFNANVNSYLGHSAVALKVPVPFKKIGTRKNTKGSKE